MGSQRRLLLSIGSVAGWAEGGYSGQGERLPLPTTTLHRVLDAFV